MNPKAGIGKSFEDDLKIWAFDGTTALLAALDRERLEVVLTGRMLEAGTGTGGRTAGREGTAGFEGLLALGFLATLAGLGAGLLGWTPLSASVLSMVLVLLIFLPLGLRKSCASSTHFSMDRVRLMVVEVVLFLTFFAIVFQILLASTQ